MSLIKKIDVPKHFAARRALALAAARPVIQPHAAGALEIASPSGKANTAKFKEDFSLKQSSLDVAVPPGE